MVLLLKPQTDPLPYLNFHVFNISIPTTHLEPSHLHHHYHHHQHQHADPTATQTALKHLNGWTGLVWLDYLSVDDGAVEEVVVEDVEMEERKMGELGMEMYQVERRRSRGERKGDREGTEREGKKTISVNRDGDGEKEEGVSHYEDWLEKELSEDEKVEKRNKDREFRGRRAILRSAAAGLED
ncbi:hypothetical protein K402DRAFT_407252 [Aulographum hederae CBS 113979]|uniref:Uncharacterized protein n=1 Tax=Aulographum hederae CBS 113979 TaxID=1176131 RepID=A0A6G1GPL9_9PEZI|nr:hypothetical protein K402DRAFT_407252 [Aulographum hederae CBS 113979]